MNPASFEIMKQTLRGINDLLPSNETLVLDVGSRVTDLRHKSYRSLVDEHGWNYVGLDVVSGHNVDLVVNNAYVWSELQPNSFDLVLCGQVFEHVDYFWLTILEISRVVRKGGWVVVIAPSSGVLHRFPVDNWRIYPDGMSVIGRFAMLEIKSVSRLAGGGIWEDTAALFQKPHWSEEDERRFVFRRDSTIDSLQGLISDPSKNTYDQSSQRITHRNINPIKSLFFANLREVLAIRDRLFRRWET